MVLFFLSSSEQPNQRRNMAVCKHRFWSLRLLQYWWRICSVFCVGASWFSMQALMYPIPTMCLPNSGMFAFQPVLSLKGQKKPGQLQNFMWQLYQCIWLYAGANHTRIWQTGNNTCSPQINGSVWYGAGWIAANYKGSASKTAHRLNLADTAGGKGGNEAGLSGHSSRAIYHSMWCLGSEAIM